MRKIQIWDGVCGIGKTRRVRTHIHRLTNGKAVFTKKDPKVIYVTPYREEVFEMADVDYSTKSSSAKAKVKLDKSGNPIRRPAPEGKLSLPFKFESNNFHDDDDDPTFLGADASIKKLIKSNVNICTTHASYFRLKDSTLDLLTNHNYHVIIDEAPEVISQMQLDKTLTEVEYQTLIKHNVLKEDTAKQLSWVLHRDDSFDRYNDVKAAISQYDCYFHAFRSKKAVIITICRKKYFEVGASTLIMTYLFPSSLCNAYMDFMGLKWEVKNLTHEELLLNDDVKEYDILINIYQPTKRKKMFLKDKYFTSGWYKEEVKKLGENPDKFKKDYEINPLKVSRKLSIESPNLAELAKSTNNFFKKATVTASPEVLKMIKNLAAATSTPVDYTLIYNDLLTVESCSLDERLWSTFKAYRKILIPKNPSFNEDRFLAFNTKATNSFRNVKAMAYLVNVHPQGDIKSFLAAKGITLDSNAYAKSELLQWIFRSRLRDGKKIMIFLPSSRMRRLLNEWIEDHTKMVEEKIKLVVRP